MNKPLGLTEGLVVISCFHYKAPGFILIFLGSIADAHAFFSNDLTLKAIVLYPKHIAIADGGLIQLACNTDVFCQS